MDSYNSQKKISCRLEKSSLRYADLKFESGQKKCLFWRLDHLEMQTVKLPKDSLVHEYLTPRYP